MQSPSTSLGRFFTYTLVAAVVIAAALFVGSALLKDCRSTKGEGFTYMSGLAKSISPEETMNAMANVEISAPAPPNPISPGGSIPPSIQAMMEKMEKNKPEQAMMENAQATSVEPMEKAGFKNMGQGSTFEGFAGPARGAGMPDCIRSSKDAAALYEMLLAKVSSTEEGADDLRELQLILGKIACFKRDLTGAAGVVAATRTQPFSTAHDLEPVAETTARCFAKTIPQRDLALSLDKWGSRGTFLLKRLCTSFGFTDHEDDEALGLFGRAMGDITDIAMSRCCNSAGEAVIAGVAQPRMIAGYEAPGLNELREYKGYY